MPPTTLTLTPGFFASKSLTASLNTLSSRCVNPTQSVMSAGSSLSALAAGAPAALSALPPSSPVPPHAPIPSARSSAADMAIANRLMPSPLGSSLGTFPSCVPNRTARLASSRLRGVLVKETQLLYGARGMSAPTIEELLAERVDGRHRGFGAVADGLAIADLGARGSTSAAATSRCRCSCCARARWRTTCAAMHGWCAERGLSLAPHGKTAMAPQLIRRQLDAGAWGMTAATVQQVAVMRAAGARRVILANELVGRAEIAWLRARARGRPPRSSRSSTAVDGGRGCSPRSSTPGRRRCRSWSSSAGRARAAGPTREALAVAAAVADADAARARRRRGIRGHARRRPRAGDHRGGRRVPATGSAVSSRRSTRAARSPASRRSSRPRAAARCSTASPSGCASTGR